MIINSILRGILFGFIGGIIGAKVALWHIIRVQEKEENNKL